MARAHAVHRSGQASHALAAHTAGSYSVEPHQAGHLQAAGEQLCIVALAAECLWHWTTFVNGG
jgi:hypothetical protein